MLKNIKITQKIPLIMITFALMSASVTGFIAYSYAVVEIEVIVKNTLSSLLESRKSALDSYFHTIQQDLTFHSQSPLVVEALQGFTQAYQVLPNEGVNYLQNNYIHRNPFSNQQKDALLKADDQSIYDALHGAYHPAFRSLTATRGFYDLFLFDTAGNLIYTVKKELDFASNLVTGPWKDTNLAKVFSKINASPQQGQAVFSDFAPYKPSNNAPASFIGMPVFDAQAEYIGVLAFQMPIEPLNKVMQVTSGMGETGETYLVGEDFLMRSDSRFFKGRSILNTQVNTSSVHKGLAGETGVGVIEDYRNIEVFSAYTEFRFLGAHWAVIAEIDALEILQPVYNMTQFLLVVGGVIASVIFLLGGILATDISNPIVAMTRMMNSLAKNELTTNISISERQDEVGDMANAMLVFKQNAIERERLQEQLKYLVNHDMLTGLPTRSYLMERLAQLLLVAKRQQKQLAVMFIDLDNFKEINDTMGHQVGDQLLKEVAYRLASCLAENDMVARIGGDEFVIVLSDIDGVEDIHMMASKILDISALDYSILGGQQHVTVSIGVAIYPDHANDVQTLLQVADDAMYFSKKQGKNNYHAPGIT